MVSYLSNLKKLFFHPKQFFKSVEKDKDYSKIMFFYVKIIIISSIIGIIASAIILGIQNSLTFLGIVGLITNSIVSIGLAFLVPFVIAGIVHLGVLIFRGKQGYYNTYKPIAYSLAIVAVYSIISTIVSAILSIINPVNNLSTTDPLLLLQNPNVIAVMAVTFTILIISLIHSLIVQVIGISKFQKISRLKAFAAIILVTLVLVIIVVLIMAFVMSQLAALA
ncbi:MAG: YIP1 family protein [Nanoarchaeota archaeon]